MYQYRDNIILICPSVPFLVSQYLGNGEDNAMLGAEGVTSVCVNGLRANFSFFNFRLCRKCSMQLTKNMTLTIKNC